MKESPTPKDLLALLQELRGARDAEPGEWLFGSMSRLRAMARKHLPPQSPLRAGLDSEDLMQEGLLQLIRNVHAFKGSSWPEFLAFAHAILHQRVARQARRQRVRGRELRPEADAATLAADQPTPSVDAVAAEDRRRVQQIAKQLPEPYRSAMLLRLEGLDNAAIAARLGLSPAALRKRLSRAVKLMHESW